jgi:hypothetical protein
VGLKLELQDGRFSLRDLKGSPESDGAGYNWLQSLEALTLPPGGLALPFGITFIGNHWP